MSHNKTNLDQILELADSEDEKKRLTQAWHELEFLTVEEPSPSASARFRQELHATEMPSDRKRRDWARAAGIFGIGLLVGALGMSVSNHRDQPALPHPSSIRSTAIVASLPLPSAAQRLAAIHLVGDLAEAHSDAREALIQRVLRDPTPALQLAAVDRLADLDLSSAETVILARALTRIDSPIVQVMLLDLLTASSNSPGIEVIQDLALNPSIDETVRRHASRAIALTRERGDV